MRGAEGGDYLCEYKWLSPQGVLMHSAGRPAQAARQAHHHWPADPLPQFLGSVSVLTQPPLASVEIPHWVSSAAEHTHLSAVQTPVRAALTFKESPQ